MKRYDIEYNDGAYYGTLFTDSDNQEEIEGIIRLEIAKNNMNPNTAYHISRSNFKEVKE